MGHEFDRGIEVTRTSAGTYDAQLDAGWVVGGGVNGGHLLAVLGSAVRRELPGKPNPITFSVNYVSPARPGAGRVATRIIRDGGSTAVVGAEMFQGDELRLTGLATFGDLTALPDDVRTTAEEPQLPVPEDCLSAHFAPADFRAIAPLFTADALPPVTFDLGLTGWAPTIELTVHVRALPAPGWMKLRHATRNVAGGLFEEDCEVWDSAGRLVAQSRQLARQPRPRVS